MTENGPKVSQGVQVSRWLIFHTECAMGYPFVVSTCPVPNFAYIVHVLLPCLLHRCIPHRVKVWFRVRLQTFDYKASLVSFLRFPFHFRCYRASSDVRFNQRVSLSKLDSTERSLRRISLLNNQSELYESMMNR